MRMNRGTIILLVALLIVIVGVLVVNNRQASAPGQTPTPNAASGPLLPIKDASTITQYEIIDTVSGHFTKVTKDDGGAWHIDATGALADRVPDQSTITSTASQITAINYSDTFSSGKDPLSTFGLDKPVLTIQVTTKDGKLYTVYIGSKSPTGARYYAAMTAPGVAATEQPGAAATAEAMAQATPEATVAQVMSTPEATAGVASTPQATPEATANVIADAGVTLSSEQTVYLIPQTVVDTLKGWLASPPYAPLPTATPTLLPIVSTPQVTAEATGAATVEPTSIAPELPTATNMATSEATTEATTQATAEATAAATAGQ